MEVLHHGLFSKHTSVWAETSRLSQVLKSSFFSEIGDEKVTHEWGLCTARMGSPRHRLWLHAESQSLRTLLRADLTPAASMSFLLFSFLKIILTFFSPRIPFTSLVVVLHGYNPSYTGVIGIGPGQPRQKV
jgi:hypothetical protein